MELKISGRNFKPYGSVVYADIDHNLEFDIGADIDERNIINFGVLCITVVNSKALNSQANSFIQEIMEKNKFVNVTKDYPEFNYLKLSPQTILWFLPCDYKINRNIIDSILEIRSRFYMTKNNFPTILGNFLICSYKFVCVYKKDNQKVCIPLKDFNFVILGDEYTNKLRSKVQSFLSSLIPKCPDNQNLDYIKLAYPNPIEQREYEIIKNDKLICRFVLRKATLKLGEVVNIFVDFSNSEFFPQKILAKLIYKENVGPNYILSNDYYLSKQNHIVDQFYQMCSEITKTEFFLSSRPTDPYSFNSNIISTEWFVDVNVFYHGEEGHEILYNTQENKFLCDSFLIPIVMENSSFYAYHLYDDF